LALTIAPDFADGSMAAAKLQQLSDAINERTPLFARVTANQNVGPSNTTLQNVTEIALVLAANAVYDFRLDLQYGTNTTADIKIGWVGPSGYAMDIAFMVFNVSETWVTGRTTESVVLGMGGTGNYAYFSGVLTTGSTAGTLQLQAAQNTSTAVATNVEAGTLLIAHRVS